MIDLFKSLIFFGFAISMIGVAYGQSGRSRTIPSPSPTPIPVVDAAESYSETKPSTRRTRLRDERPIVVAGAVDDGETLRIETNLITIPVSVYDRNGLYIPGLSEENFKIFDNGVEQDIEYFATTDQPFTVALVIDVSPSTAYRIEEIRRSAMAFVDLLKPEDRVIVIDFDENVRVRQDATTDRQKISRAIEKADFGNGTALYNAVDEALRKRLGRISGRKAVVLFTDGVDTKSRKNSYDSTLRFAEESDTLIFPIYYNTFMENRQQQGLPPIRGGIWSGSGTTAGEYALGRKYLEELAEATGGRIFRPESTPGGLTRAFEGIAEELRRQYNIGYVPKTEGKPGERRQIRVRVDRPNLIVRSRDSYIVVNTANTTTPK